MWSHPFFSESCFLASNIWKKLGKKFGLKKMRCGVVWGGEGRWINETGNNVLPFLNVSLHCFDEQN